MDSINSLPATENSKVINMGYDGHNLVLGHNGIMGPDEFCHSIKTPGSIGLQVPSLEPLLSVDSVPSNHETSIDIEHSLESQNHTGNGKTETFIRPNRPPSTLTNVAPASPYYLNPQSSPMSGSPGIHGAVNSPQRPRGPGRPRKNPIGFDQNSIHTAPLPSSPKPRNTLLPSVSPFPLLPATPGGLTHPSHSPSPPIVSSSTLILPIVPPSPAQPPSKKPKLYEDPNKHDKRIANATHSKQTRERKKNEEFQLHATIAKQNIIIETLNSEKKEILEKNQLLNQDISMMETMVLASNQLAQNFRDQISTILLQSPFSSSIQNVIFYPGLLQQLRTRSFNGVTFVPDTSERYNLGSSMDFSTGTIYLDAAPAQLFPQPPFPFINITPPQPPVQQPQLPFIHSHRQLQVQPTQQVTIAHMNPNQPIKRHHSAIN